MATVYLETSIISYLASRPSRDLIVAAHQQITQDWWETRYKWELVISALVIAESQAGDPEASKRRIGYIQGLPILVLNDAVVNLAEKLLNGSALPPKAKDDALHIAIATVYQINYLLTWNCKHIANANKRSVIENICREAGYRPSIICTPEELLGDDYVE
jgi:predicted nucleic acid-binding protein